MPEYTIAVITSLILLAVIDIFVAKTKLLGNKRFWIFLFFVVALQTIVDNYLNGRWWLESYIVGPYPEQFYSGIRVIETPLENYGFGIAMMMTVLIVFERLERNRLNQTKPKTL